MTSNREKVTLSQIADYKTGKLNSNAAIKDGDYPFFTCSRETFRTNTWSFDCECVLLAGNNANAEYPVKYFQGKFDAYQRTYVITAKDPLKLNIRYLYYCIELKLNLLKSLSTGAATRFLTKGILDNLEFDLPPIENQNEIVGVLGGYDNLIENNNRRIAILEDMAQSLYREWFVKFRFPNHEACQFKDSPLGQIPEGWELSTLKETIELAYGKALKKADRKGGDVSVYGSGGLGGWHNESLVDGPCIIVGRKGNVGSVFWVDENCWPIDTVFYVKSEYSKYYLYYNLLHQVFHNSDAAVPGLNRESAYSNKIIIPSAELLTEFDEFTVSIFNQLRVLRKKSNNLKAQRDFLLPKLISGKIKL